MSSAEPLNSAPFSRQRHQVELAALNEILSGVSKAGDARDVLAWALDVTLAALSADAGEIFLTDPHSRRLNRAIYRSDDDQAFAGKDQYELGEGLVGAVANGLEPLLFDLQEPDRELLRPALRDAGFVRMAAAPLIAHDRLWGAVTVLTRDPRGLADDVVMFLSAVGRQIGLALALADAIDGQLAFQRRLEAVSRATAAVAGAQRLDEVFAEIVSQARAMTGAQYGAIGVHSPDGVLSRFIHQGMPEDVAQRIGELPHGRGLLAALRDDPVIRLPDLMTDPRFRGFPPHHPAMHSFLGVSVRTENRVFGRLYLAEKENSEQFSAADEAIVVSLAQHAGIAIANATLYENLTRQTRYLAAVYNVGKQVTSSLEFEHIIEAVTGGAVSAVGADNAVVLLAEGAALRCIAAAGFTTVDPRGVLLQKDQGAFGRVISTGMPVLVGDVSEELEALEELLRPEGVRAMLLAPVRSGSEVYGVLGVGYQRQALTVNAQEAIYALADLAAIAITNSRLFEQSQELAVVREREQIAMDLHDTTLQELFAAGLQLDSAAEAAARNPAEAVQLMEGVRGRLQDLNRSIRAYISGLSRPEDRAHGALPDEVAGLLAEVDASGGTHTSLEADPGTYPELDPDRLEHLLGVVREAVNNAHRHAGARLVSVRLGRQGAGARLTVADDGAGFHVDGAGRAGHFGLRNMRQRAALAGASFELTSVPGEGTRVELAIPG